jgi:hypothetical protein
VTTNTGGLVLQIRRDHNFTITCPDGKEIKVIYLGRKGSTTNILIQCDKEYIIRRTKEVSDGVPVDS